MNCGTLGKVAKILAIIGAINWGLVAGLEYNLVDSLLGSLPAVAQIVYILVGLSGVYLLVGLCSGKCSK